ncbi:MAG: hypothetical protein O7C60_06075 [Rickettsia endosymbiont of Ixodes persulcatus]|nr:hypothetical protein [Rickettsia endosymbiont of Ixodes persulcatus]
MITQSHYADVKTILDWFYSINIKLQQKVMFVPNRYQHSPTEQLFEQLKYVAIFMDKDKTDRTLTTPVVIAISQYFNTPIDIIIGRAINCKDNVV